MLVFIVRKDHFQTHHIPGHFESLQKIRVGILPFESLGHIHQIVVDQLCGSGSLFGIDAQHGVNHVTQLLGVQVGDGRELAAADLVAERLHAVGPEGRQPRAEFVEHDAQRPDVALGVVGFVLPDFGRALLGRPGLRLRQLVLALQHFRHVQVPQLHFLVPAHEQVRRFDVAVDDVVQVQIPQPFQCALDDTPNVFFVH